MRRFDAVTRPGVRSVRFIADGAHTLSGDNTTEIPVEDIYNWPSWATGCAWPLHQERGHVPATPPPREHRRPPGVSPWISPTEPREWDQDGYEEAVVSLLTFIFSSRNRSGSALLHELGGPIKVIPLSRRDPVNDDGVYRPNTGFAYSRAHGAYVLHTPGHFPARLRACTLFHELVHVARAQARIYSQGEQPYSDRRYTQWEEFPAVVIENIYRSEHRIPLRWGHYDVSTSLSNPDTWYNHPRNQMAIERVARQMNRLAMNLSRVQSRFNPFRQHFERVANSQAPDTESTGLSRPTGSTWGRRG